MAYVDGFEHDIFLSYPRVEDRAAAGEQGWVSRFEMELWDALDRRTGRPREVKIWRDSREIDGGRLFDRTIENALDASAVFVALTSRGYLRSDYCRKELGYFSKRATGDRFGLVIGDRPRIVNVLLTNLDPNDWPSEFGRVPGFDLHDAVREDENETGEPSVPGSLAFKQQLKALGYALYRLLDAMKDASRPAGPRAKDAKGTVFRLTSRIRCAFRPGIWPTTFSGSGSTSYPAFRLLTTSPDTISG